MRIIDSHVHVWNHDPEYPWAKDELDIPQYNASPSNLINLMEKNDVEHAVLVQYVKYRWDNRYVAHILRNHPSMFNGVCRVDPENQDSPDQLSYWTESFGFRGVRLSPEPDARGDWFTGPLMPPLFKRASDLRVPVILLIKPSRLPDLSAIIEKVPDVKLIIDHLADCINLKNNDLQTLIDFARYPNLFLKIGHIPQSSAEAFPWKDTHEMMARVFQAYGARRMMWGSDWPFSLSRTTYSQSIAYLQNELNFLTVEDREWALGKTALQFWPFSEKESFKCQ
jgi:predicted TIM-barrel fold metal-dependent hydrolase